MSVPHVTDAPPEAVARDLRGLRDALDERLPARTIDRNLLIGTWNVRHFGGLTERWRAGDDDSPKRDLHSVRVIAEIIRRFDVVAIQEIRGDLKALRHTMKALGPDWGFVLTDVTRGDPGNDERLGFIFDRRTTRISGLAGELVVPADEFDRIDPDALDRQFARTPYAVAFESGGETFVLVTLHVLWGDRPDERTPELRAIAEWLDEWARDVNAWDHNLIALGDFNIDRRGDERYDAFVSTGLEVPADLHAVPRTIFADPGDPGEHFYDQIAWFTGDAGQPALSLDYVRGGSFDFVDVALPRRDLTRASLSWRISDHYPLWAEFSRR
ncbi:endonuclease/exonuclease/phosphatase family protein [Haloplanus rubicundus]|uniref:endonuclease/exonuclease/phosphatase family protein n=1 Tax=Haloplanus rubicundus TaxID=1547898 RepID=UPI001CA40241|nr:endonuclease/exonuclease/phosphatase family protein [Haloplanus rubicundus]